MEIRSKFALSAIAVLGASVLWLGYKIHELKEEQIMAEGDTPILVSDGSIYATAYSQGWKPSNPHKKYWVKVGKNDNIQLEEFSSNPSFAHTQGWKIEFRNKDSQGNPKSDALMLCSNDDCDPTKGVDNNGKAYIHADGNGQWTEMGGSYIYELQFHDTDCGTSTACDHIYDVTVTTSTHVSDGTYTCAGDCRVVVGVTP